jgi:hypothetical protein
MVGFLPNSTFLSFPSAFPTLRPFHAWFSTPTPTPTPAPSSSSTQKSITLFAEICACSAEFSGAAVQAQQKTMCGGARVAAKLCARWDAAEGNAALALVVAGVFE